jgi:hypothetical protein
LTLKSDEDTRTNRGKNPRSDPCPIVLEPCAVDLITRESRADCERDKGSKALPLKT